jgi:hypothetical protein
MTAVADARERERITVEGEVTSLLVRPLADVPTVEVRISDATGTLSAVFLGRRRNPRDPAGHPPRRVRRRRRARRSLRRRQPGVHAAVI